MDRIAPGHHLYQAPDGSWRHHAPQGGFTRIKGPADALAQARDGAYGLAPTPGDPDLVAALRARGVLAPSGGPRPGPWSVHVSGANAVADAVAALLADSARVVRGELDEDAVRAVDAVVCCAGWLPDARWRRIDTWCREQGTVWHRCHAEGLSWVLGPLTVPGATVGYTDVRGRLLAAADLPDEVAGLWHHLDQEGAAAALPPVPWPGRGAAAVLAGLLVADLERWHTTGEPAARDTQLVLDPATLTVERHRVLPLPATAGQGADDRVPVAR